MNFAGAGAAKAWKDIWGAGQGVGAVKQVVPAGSLVQRLADEYAAARRRLALA
jgi:nitronate monooxygenase